VATLLQDVAAVYNRTLNQLAAVGDGKTTLGKFCPGLSEAEIDLALSLIAALTGVTIPLAQFVEDREKLPQDRQLAASVLTYFLMPIDLLPDDEMGFAGYLDDALYALLAIGRLQYPSDDLLAWRARWQDAGATLLDALPDWIGSSLGNILSQTSTPAPVPTGEH
jgi:uncharacterized membrane protein YkvA (DUF1232 family)